VLQCFAVCCSVLQCVAVCYSVLQCVTVCRQWDATWDTTLHGLSLLSSIFHEQVLFNRSLYMCTYWPSRRTLPCVALQSATHCTTLPHTATHCNRLGRHLGLHHVRSFSFCASLFVYVGLFLCIQVSFTLGTQPFEVRFFCMKCMKWLRLVSSLKL